MMIKNITGEDMIRNGSLMQYFKPMLGFVLLAIINQPSLADDGSGTVVRTEYFESVDGKVDAGTFVGWNVYNHACVECHGVGAVGTELAPDLTQSIDKLSPGRFRAKVLHRISMSYSEGDRMAMQEAMMAEVMKQQKRDRGELENMPKWHYNPTIRQHIGNIYSYLKARSAGVIGPDRPGIIKE